MSTPEKPDHARGWLYVEKLLDEGEDDPVAKLGEDARAAKPDQAGTESANEWSADELLGMAEARAAKQAASAPPAAPVASLPVPPEEPVGPASKIAPVIPIRRPWKIVGLVAAACVAALLIAKLTNEADVVSHPRPDRVRAESDRDMAEASCAAKAWAACKDRLDEAAKLDPEGEREPRVQKARAEIAAGGAGGPEKPRP